MPALASYIFAASVGFILYVLVGYPLALALAARLRGRSLQRNWSARSVSLVVPVHNGQAWIEPKIESIANLDYPKELLQVIFVDDGSTDRSAELIRRCAAPGTEVITIPRGGKALALNAGIQESRGEILFFTDIRQRLDRDSLRHLVECFADSRVGVVSGELVILEGASQQEADIGLYWRYEKSIRKRQGRLGCVPGATGSIYAMRRDLAAALPAQTLLDDVYLPLAAFFRGYRIVFDERARAFDHPTALKTEFRRKVRTQAGVWQIVGAFPRLLLPTSLMWFHFGSHKLGRLLLPEALMAIALSSFWLPPVPRLWTLLAQTAFYGVAALDWLVPHASPAKRATSIARTFVVLVGAAFCAPFFLLTNRGASGWAATDVQPAAATPHR